jgi:hypothetical protein
VTMQVFVREHCTMIAAPVQCNIDGIPKRSHYATVPPIPVATYIEILKRRASPPTVKQHMAATYSYDARFDAENTGYQRLLNIFQEIKPGETDRFTVKISVRLSSFHRFRTTIRDISGETFKSEAIEMNCFVPRCQRDAVARKMYPPSG